MPKKRATVPRSQLPKNYHTCFVNMYLSCLK